MLCFNIYLPTLLSNAPLDPVTQHSNTDASDLSGCRQRELLTGWAVQFAVRVDGRYTISTGCKQMILMTSPHVEICFWLDAMSFYFPKAAAKGSFEESVLIKACEAVAVFKDCHQTLPKILLK